MNNEFSEFLLYSIGWVVMVYFLCNPVSIWPRRKR